ncbi:RagB/SusD family nutrient uptake outer membrane protein [uncultured Tenacibaculum sp.]|uniref:RagB/SusD family nutrient uptake outer membrane protein n=1 Tax=uncultured Tenacibaculum sp. TaxID=174713 RepID=UPI00260EA7FA|nr:RagB/SusD family nutrient uptake outer membrane protein [uncultured Tenacibaculum sp.]
MKQIKYISILVIIMLMTYSCSDNFLEPAPVGTPNGETFYSNDDELELGVINMYDGIQGINSTSSNDNHSIQVEFYVTEMRSDNTQTKSSEGEAAQFENYTIEANNGIVEDYYRSFYNIIFRANIILENLDNATAANRSRFEGEAKFVRAYAYFNLVRLYGDIPLIEGVIAPGDKEVQFTRRPKSDIYNLIESDLNRAIETLENGSKNRASRAAAQTLLAKVYMTTENKRYLEAQQLCEVVMNSGFSLESNFKDIFFNEGNNEIIFSIGYIGDDAQNSQNFSAEWLNAVGRTSGVNYVTPDAKAALDNFGGDRTQFSYRVDQAQPTRFQVVKYIPDGDATLGIDPTSSNPTQAGNDWIVLRYADVLLLHVEAIMGASTETSVPAALASFQLVRNRAGLTTPVTTITKDDLLLERRVELAFENHRLFDLLRFNKAQETLSAFSSSIGASFSATDLLLPIPQREVNLGGGVLNQNPGY